MKLREQVNKRRNEILKSKDMLSPKRATEILNELSALYGNVLDRAKETQMLFNKKLAEIMEDEKAATKARVKAETTDEYEAMLEAKNVEKLILELTRSLKYFIRVKEAEYSEMIR